MTKPTLYLMLGYPGAGKTTIAKAIHELTGSVHLWADHIRRELYDKPTYAHEENIRLYNHLNQLTGELLAADNSVIFDTNFNFYKDRQHLRAIAKQHGATTKLIWITTPKDIARERATKDAHKQHTRVLGDMSIEHFERISNNFEPPRDDEPHVQIDGTNVTKQEIKNLLKLDE
jgi:predicted kinase